MTEALFSVAEIYSFVNKKRSGLLCQERADLLDKASSLLDEYVISSWPSLMSCGVSSSEFFAVVPNPSHRAVITSLAIEYESVDKALMACGLTDFTTLSVAQIRKLSYSMGVSPDGIISPDQLRLLCEKARRSFTRTKAGITPENGMYRLSDVISALTRKNHSDFMLESCVEAAEHISATSQYYRDLLDKELELEREKNERGDLALLARHCAKRPGNRPGDIAMYQCGRLPESHLRQRALRTMMRRFITDLWEESHPEELCTTQS